MLDFIRAERHKLLAEETPNSKGLESVLVNDVAISSDWKVETSWTFRGSSHINILEEASLLRLTQRLAKLKYPTRVTSLVDSNVVRGATSKGRSSSKGLSRVLLKLNATMVAAGLYMHTPFCPTRLNVSDDPTRDVQLRPPASGLPISSLSREDLFRLATLPKLRRWAANWCRLLLRVAGLHLIFLPCRDLYRRCHSSLEFSHSSMDFDASLGFPGEGPGFRQLLAFAAFCLLCCGLPSPFCVPLWILTPCLTSSLPSSCFACFLLSVVELPSLSPGRAMAMPIAPQTPAEMKKSLARGSQPPLAEGRPVLPTTGSLRDKYFKVFESWTREEGIDIHALLEHSHQYVEEINIVVSRFGRELFRAGKTYNQYAETINSLTSMRPSLRRQMQGAWDLGFAWMRQEPHAAPRCNSVHHFDCNDNHLTFMGVGTFCWVPSFRLGISLTTWRDFFSSTAELAFPRGQWLFDSVRFGVASGAEDKVHYSTSPKYEAGRTRFGKGGLAEFWQAAT